MLGNKRTGIARIQSHGLKAFPLPQRGAGPLPDTTHLALPAKPVPVCSHGDGVPVLEADVGTVQIDEEVILLSIGGPDCTS